MTASESTPTPKSAQAAASLDALVAALRERGYEVARESASAAKVITPKRYSMMLDATDAPHSSHITITLRTEDTGRSGDTHTSTIPQGGMSSLDELDQAVARISKLLGPALVSFDAPPAPRDELAAEARRTREAAQRLAAQSR